MLGVERSQPRENKRLRRITAAHATQVFALTFLLIAKRPSLPDRHDHAMISAGSLLRFSQSVLQALSAPCQATPGVFAKELP